MRSTYISQQTTIDNPNGLSQYLVLYAGILNDARLMDVVYDIDHSHSFDDPGKGGKTLGIRIAHSAIV